MSILIGQGQCLAGLEHFVGEVDVFKCAVVESDDAVGYFGNVVGLEFVDPGQFFLALESFEFLVALQIDGAFLDFGQE